MLMTFCFHDNTRVKNLLTSAHLWHTTGPCGSLPQISWSIYRNASNTGRKRLSLCPTSSKSPISVQHHQAGFADGVQFYCGSIRLQLNSCSLLKGKAVLRLRSGSAHFYLTNPAKISVWGHTVICEWTYLFGASLENSFFMLCRQPPYSTGSVNGGGWVFQINLTF